MTPLKPPFAYFGGKTSIAERIVSLLPPHEHYVEPFAGSLAVLLAKPPSRIETVNDLDGDLMTFWRVLRDDPDSLARVCVLTPHARAELIASYDRDSVPDDLERARRVWVVLTQGRGGHLWRGKGWRHFQDASGTACSLPDFLAAYTERLAPAARRLQKVSLECLPALEVIAKYGRHKTGLIYADPPYLKTARTWTNGNGYGHEMYDEASHRELAQALRSSAAGVVLSGYDDPLYTELYGDWHRAEISAHARNGIIRERTEVLWSNRPFPATLFDEIAATQHTYTAACDGHHAPGPCPAAESSIQEQKAT